MPKSLDEYKALKTVEGRQGGRKVNWDEIAKTLNELHEAYTVKEIWEHPELVNKRVTQFRTMNALNKLFDDGKISRKYDGKRYWFCRKVTEVKNRGRTSRKS